MAKLPTLRKRKDFELTQRKGHRIHSYFFNLYFFNSELKGLGITVSKKVSKKAVVRNRIRRVCRETVRVHFHNLAENFSLVVIARSTAAELSRKELRENLINVLSKIKR